MAAVVGVDSSAQKFNMTTLSTKGNQGMITKLKQMVVGANQRIQQLQTEVDFETYDYPVPLVQEIGIDLIKKAITISAAQLGKIVGSRLEFWETNDSPSFFLARLTLS